MYIYTRLKHGKSKDFVLPSASVGVAETETKNTTTHQRHCLFLKFFLPFRDSSLNCKCKCNQVIPNTGKLVFQTNSTPAIMSYQISHKESKHNGFRSGHSSWPRCMSSWKEPDLDEDRQSHLQEKCSNHYQWKIISLYIRLEVQGNKTCWSRTSEKYDDPPKNLDWDEQ